MNGQVTKVDLHDMIRELCEPTTHREPYSLTLVSRTLYHVTTWPALLVQLSAAGAPKGTAEAGIPKTASSRPTANLDALDTLIRIDDAAARIVREWGEDDPGDTIRCVRMVGALAASRDPHRAHSEVRRWWTWARVTTGWDLPAWAPANTCPLCGERGTLRIRMNEMIATCINDQCRETWGEDTIGLLADHIRAENGEGEVAS